MEEKELSKRDIKELAEVFVCINNLLVAMTNTDSKAIRKTFALPIATALGELAGMIGGKELLGAVVAAMDKEED